MASCNPPCRSVPSAILAQGIQLFGWEHRKNVSLAGSGQGAPPRQWCPINGAPQCSHVASAIKPSALFESTTPDGSVTGPVMRSKWTPVRGSYSSSVIIITHLFIFTNQLGALDDGEGINVAVLSLGVGKQFGEAIEVPIERIGVFIDGYE